MFFSIFICFKTHSDEVISDMSRLAEMIKAICELAGDVVNDYDYNAISSWWQYVRELLLDSPKSLGLLVAIVCKTVAISLRHEFKEVIRDIYIFNCIIALFN